MRMNHLFIILFLILGTVVVGCGIAEHRGQEVSVGDLILNQEMISSVQISAVDGSYSYDIADDGLEDPTYIASLLKTLNGIPAKRLTVNEESAFWPERILAKHLSVEFQNVTDPARTTQGLILIWPDGRVAVADMETMVGSNRTVFYFSESTYPELYNRLWREMPHHN